MAAQRKRSSTMRDRARAAIKRTQPACHICGLPIAYELPHTDPKSFVVDHVVPIHRGGADNLSNMKAAHRDCNSTKRARSHAPIIRRSGSLQ